MRQRALKLGTRRSALARAQSAAIAQQLERLHSHLTVELVGIDTRGDRIPDLPLRTVEGKEFFTAEIDAALLRGEIDFTVHSYKDLSLERAARFRLAAVPRRAEPHDVVLFARDAPERLASGQQLIVGSSSPRRASFVPSFLEEMLPHRCSGTRHSRVRFVELRGNVDSRLRRLHEARGSPRQLDGVVLAFAGIARLWADEAARVLAMPALSGLPRMVLPLSLCPAAPAQGALAVECRAGDSETAQLLAGLDHAATRRAVDVERALLARLGGGCHQRFGATQFEVPGLGTLLYAREAHERGETLQVDAVQLRWTPEHALPPILAPVRAWDGSRARRGGVSPIDSGVAAAAERLQGAGAVFIAHRRALPESDQVRIDPQTHVWVPGVDTWRALAARGVWVEGCAQGLGFAHLEPLLRAPWLQLPSPERWLVLTHADAAAEWRSGEVIATYQHSGEEGEGPTAEATHLYWASGAQFEHWRHRVRADAEHACGPGKTHTHLHAAGVRPLRMFPQVQQWREWLGL